MCGCRTSALRYGGVETVRRAGEPVHDNIMHDWKHLRLQRPDLFQHVEVYSQPACVVDAVIYKWQLESIQQQYGDATLWVRDTCGGAG